MDKAERVLARLDALGISYTLARHAAVSTIAECALPEKLLGALMPRNLFLCPRTRAHFCLLTAHPASVFRTGSISRQANSSRLSFAGAEDMAALLGTFPGAVSPLGLMFDTDRRVELLLDKRLAGEKELLFHPLDNTATLRLTLDSLLNVFLPACGHGVRYVEMD
ncbi:MAG: prolyl-tRNA synthetase associated domain-containing protein [Clostridia bacterium]|nr:prolyl-tRNA synthetase associated domain-containing protein [Clostridia bacterium]